MFDEAGRKQHITEAAPNELNTSRVGNVMIAGHRVSGGVGGVRAASFEEKNRRFGAF